MYSMGARILIAQLIIAFVAASPAPSNPSGTPGCGIDHPNLAGGSSKNFTVKSSGGNRTFLVHVPRYYRSNAATGLVLSYHGNSRTATSQEKLSQFSNETLNPDWIAVYPQGVGVSNSWQGPSYAAKGVSDLQFTTDLLNYMRDNFCIDNSRIYATGKSNGGGFVGTLACAAEGGNFAAFAPVSGAFYTDADSNTSYVCTPARSPLPILEFHGTNDTTIPYLGGSGKGGELPTIPDWLARWAVRDGCPSPPMKTTTTPATYGGKVHITSYGCAGHTNIVQGYKIDGLGHDWPSTEPNSDSSTPTVIEATSVIVKFFQKYTKP